MNVDTTEFAAIRDQVAENTARVAAFSRVLVAIGEAGRIDVPDVLRPHRPQLRLVHGQGRHSKPRARLRAIDGGGAA